MLESSAARQFIAAAGTALGLLAGGPALADTYRLSFSGSGFKDASGLAPPTDPVQGSIDFTATALGAAVISVLAIDLTIDGHTYALNEVGAFAPQPTGSYYFGDPVGGGVNGFMTGIDDFGIGVCMECGPGLPPNQGALAYTSSLHSNGLWDVNSILDPTSVFLFSIVAIPEPATAVTMLAGLALLYPAYRRRPESRG